MSYFQLSLVNKIKKHRAPYKGHNFEKTLWYV